MSGMLLRRVEDMDIPTQGGRPCEDGDRDWSYVAKSQGVPGATTDWKRQERILL